MRHNSPTAAFQRATGRQPQRVGEFSESMKRSPGEVLPPQAMFHYWHPDRLGVEHCSHDFDDKLKAIHHGLHACRPPANVPAPADQRWIIWQRDATQRNKLCPGWKLLFLWPSPQDSEPIPLDHRVFANLAIINPARYRNATEYFDTVIAASLIEDKAAYERNWQQHRKDVQADYRDARKIKNIGAGNKFALHHDGGVVPSRGEQNWVRERQKHMLPSEVIRQSRNRG